MRKTGWVLLVSLLAVGGFAVADEGEYLDPVVRSEGRVLPDYPPAALAAGFEGVVTLAAVINSDGSLGAVEVVEDDKPHLGFGDAAMRAVRGWSFEAARVDGQSVDAVGAFVFRFHPVGRVSQGSYVTGSLFLSAPINDGLTDKTRPGQFTDNGFTPAKHLKMVMQKYGLPPGKPFAMYDRTKLIPVPRRTAGVSE
jgi:TonB family protein